MDETSIAEFLSSSSSLDESLERCCEILLAAAAEATREWGDGVRLVLMFQLPGSSEIVLWHDALWDKITEKDDPALIFMKKPRAFYDRFPEEYFRIIKLPIGRAFPNIEASFRSYRYDAIEHEFSSAIYFTVSMQLNDNTESG